MANWIVFADSAHARIFRQAGRGKPLELQQEIAHPESEARRQDIVSDRPGVTGSWASPQRAAYAPDTDPKQNEQDRFARDLAALLDKGDFGALVVFAAPKFLGMLKTHLSEATRRKLAAAVNENLVNLARERAGEVVKRYWAVPARPFESY